jgi:phosphate transport system substrate-binding protein
VTSATRSARGTPWLTASAAAVLIALAASAWLAIARTRGPSPQFAARSAPPGPERHRADEALVLAGSGSNLPVTRALAAAWAAHGAPPPVVHTSIGSGGGMRALRDGAVDVALVSRPLSAEEREANIAVPYARVPIYIGVHASVPDQNLTRAELIEIFEGTRTQWSDGSRIVVLQRERGDSSHGAVNRVVPEFEAANQRAYQARRWHVINDDVSMNDALASTEGAIGLLGAGVIPNTLPIRALAFEGVAPTLEGVELGAYPFHKDLAMVTRGEPDERAAAFFRFVFSREGQAIIRELGAIPLGAEMEREL